MSVDSRRSESALIRRLRAELQCPPGLGRPDGRDRRPLDFVDDMAAVNGAGEGLLWTADMIMDGVDFDSRRHGWGEIGRKAMAVNLSDCAAMAVRPVSALCAVALNDRMSMENAVELMRGAHIMGLRFGCPVVGGDTNSWDKPTVVSISIAGRPEAGFSPARRDGARPGDVILVTGPLGGSILGRHMTFEPRVDLALEINRRLTPHAMIDVSDGLALDLYRVLEASGCGGVIEAAGLDAVIHADSHALAAGGGLTAREHALFDGEDFELIVVVRPDVVDVARGMGLSVIGRIDGGTGLRLREADRRERPIERRGWEHFT